MHELRYVCKHVYMFVKKVSPKPFQYITTHPKIKAQTYSLSSCKTKYNKTLKLFWLISVDNSIINNKSKNSPSPTCIIDNNKTITNPKQIANSFNVSEKIQ